MTNDGDGSTRHDVGMMPLHFGCLHLTLSREMEKISNAFDFCIDAAHFDR